MLILFFHGREDGSCDLAVLQWRTESEPTTFTYGAFQANARRDTSEGLVLEFSAIFILLRDCISGVDITLCFFYSTTFI